MSHNLRIGSVHLLLSGALLLGACSDAPGGVRGTPPERRPALSAAMREHTGLSHLPEITDGAEFAARLKRHYPAKFRERGVSGTALVDVHVDARGRVRNVEVVRRPGAPPHQDLTAILEEKGGSRVLRLNDQPEFGAAAQAAFRETRFHPALRDGKAVAYKLRTTVEFGPDPAGG